MNLLDIGGRRRQPGTDRPDRLIGHHQIGRRGAVRQRSRELAATNIERLAVIALLPGLADADDGNKTGAPAGLRLQPHQRVTLTMIGAALRMADDDRGGAGIRQHFGREVAGMGARDLGMAILGTDRQRFGSACSIGEAGDQGRRRANQEIGLGSDARGAGTHRVEFGDGGLEAVHFPVAGNHRPDGVGHMTFPRSCDIGIS